MILPRRQQKELLKSVDRVGREREASKKNNGDV